MSRALLTNRCSCGRHGVVLFHDEFWCGLCDDVLLEDSPAHEYARMEAAQQIGALVDAIDAELSR